MRYSRFMKSLILALFSLLILTTTASAGDPTFYELSDRLHAKENGLIIQTLNEPSDPVYEQLEHHAYELTQIWVDTILEADFAVAHEVRLNGIQEIDKDGRLIAYRITYSDGAWETSNCSYSETTSTEGCEPGVIIESAFVRPDFSEAWRDHRAFATFRKLLGL
jgi:hypothetical protein